MDLDGREERCGDPNNDLALPPAHPHRLMKERAVMIKDIRPMKMTDLPVDQAEGYLDDGDWFLEQKMDGARGLVTWTREDGFSWQASGGGPLKFAAAAQHLPVIEAELVRLFEAAQVTAVVVDGEVLVEEGTYHVFDLPYVHYAYQDSPMIVPEEMYVHRRNCIDRIFGMVPGATVKIVPSARTSREKILLWHRIREEGVEGGMLKRWDAPYESGARVKHQLKLKLVKTADVIVTRVERRFDEKDMVTHGSAELSIRIPQDRDPKPYRNFKSGKRIDRATLDMLKEGSPRARAQAKDYMWAPRDYLVIGNASLIGKDKSIDVGDVVEVAYLYWTGGALIQPRIIRKRRPEEKAVADCWIDQLPEYSRKAVWV